MQFHTGFLVVFVTAYLGYAHALTGDPDIIRCRQCNHVTSLELCQSLIACNRHAESCYMDQFISLDAKVYYTGGCRNKAVCQSATSLIFGKRDGEDLKSCSRCCNSKDDCNKRLCGITTDNLNAQCYSCDTATTAGDQGLVSDPSECNTLDYCQDDEICLAYTRKTVAGDRYGFRCEKLTKESPFGKHNGSRFKKICDTLMERVLVDFAACHDDPDPNLCGILDRKRLAETCYVCCGDGGCNSRSCEEIKEDIWQLKTRGALNETTWRAI